MKRRTVCIVGLFGIATLVVVSWVFIPRIVGKQKLANLIEGDARVKVESVELWNANRRILIDSGEETAYIETQFRRSIKTRGDWSYQMQIRVKFKGIGYVKETVWVSAGTIAVRKPGARVGEWWHPTHDIEIGEEAPKELISMLSGMHPRPPAATRATRR